MMKPSKATSCPLFIPLVCFYKEGPLLLPEAAALRCAALCSAVQPRAAPLWAAAAAQRGVGAAAAAAVGAPGAARGEALGRTAPFPCRTAQRRDGKGSQRRDTRGAGIPAHLSGLRVKAQPRCPARQS